MLSGTVSASAVNIKKSNGTIQINDKGIAGTGNKVPTSSKTISTIPLNITYPDCYDLRSLGKLTNVKDQGQEGDCWTFGTTGSLESNLLPYENDSFSENNMKNILSNSSPDGFDFSDGGSYDMAVAYLAGWKGPIYEYQDPYNDTSVYSSTENLSPAKHVQDVLILPSRSNSLDNNYIKWALMNYGAVGTYIFMNESAPYYNDQKYSYYYNGTESIDHALDIVGWDDNYDKSNFDITPPGNGAFIIRNSWGSDWGDNGYFYVSYYDTELGIGTSYGGSYSPNFVFIDAENTTNYNKNYQYDPYGWVSSTGYDSNTGWFSNVFNSTGNDVLSAASFYVFSPNSTYNLYVYLNPTKNNPRSGTLVANLTGTLMSGYWTINLPSSIDVLTDELFSVVVKLTTPENNYPIPIEEAEQGYSSKATFQPGQSYISSNGITWNDAYNYSYAVCLKAFTTPHIIQPTSLTLNNISGVKGDFINLTAILTNNNTNQLLIGKTVDFFINGEKIGTTITDLNGEAILNYDINDNPGIYQISAVFNGDYDCITSDINSALTIIDNTPPSTSINHVGGYYNTTQTINLKTTDPDSTAITYYTLDGSNPQISSTRSIYDGTAIIITNTTLLMYSSVDPTGNWSPNYNQTYIIDTIPPTAKNSINSGLYNSNKVVILSMNKSGTIYYTMNGITPTTTSTKYSGPITISSNTTIKFLAVDLFGNKSPVYNNTYTIDKTAPKIATTIPTNNKTGISRTSALIIKFSENIKNSTYFNNITVKNLTTNKYVTIKKVINGSSITITTTTTKTANTWYTVTIPKAAIKDNANNNLLSTYTFKFKTGKK